MRRSVRNLIMGLSAVAVAAAGLVILSTRGTDPEDVLKAIENTAQLDRLAIEYPLDETLFPPEIPAPCFRWKDIQPRSGLWLVAVEFSDGQEPIASFARQARWRPEEPVWEDIKKRSLEKPATVTIFGVNRKTPSQAFSAGHITIKTSSHKVAAPLFYREVNLPFVDAVRDPSRIRWRFGAVSSEEAPPIVLENLPVCGNCHSFSADAAVLGMDVDYANDKGSYAVAAVRKHLTLDKSTIITWSDYKRSENEITYGLLSQVSPDGRFVASTVKDESVFVPKPGLDFSQLFFPVKGILCIYDRQTGVFQSLPGADDPNLVQSNPTWSPDGKYLVFAATQAYSLRGVRGPRKVLLSPDECCEFLQDGKPFKFNLYRIPFNDGRGGPAEPLAGASFNGKSNFFPKYSPDGKWIVFCRAENYMLLQPDSELYIIPAEGGEARRLRANTERMNSWHSFSPNGRWLVFSGKPDSPYTRLFLTHIDENGESTIQHCLRAVQLKPDHAQAHDKLGVALCRKGALHEGLPYLSKAVSLEPDNAAARYNLAVTLARLKRHDQAIVHWLRLLRLDPRNADVLSCLAASYAQAGQLDKALSSLQQALDIAFAAGNEKLVGQITRQMALYRQNRPPDNIAGGNPGKQP